MNVFVTVGTHEQPFQRLLDAASVAVSARPQDSWVVQSGVGAWRPTEAGNVVAASSYFDATTMQEHLAWADLVVSQSSPGTVFSALAAGARPVVVGRRSGLGEHVDDHQLRFARELDRRGLARDLSDADPLGPALVTALVDESSRCPEQRRERCLRLAADSAENTARFRAEVWDVLGASS